MRYGVIRELTSGYGVSESDIIELEILHESKAEDWSILKRKDDRLFDTQVKIAMEKDLPIKREEIGIRDFPVGLFTSDSGTKLTIGSTLSKVCWYETRSDPNTNSMEPVPILKEETSGKIVKKIEDVIRVEGGRVVGSCGAPYFWMDKVVAFHFESNNDFGSGSAHSHVSFSLGYVLCRLPCFMDK